MCQLRGEECTGDTAKSYACDYCRTESEPVVKCCANCFRSLYQAKQGICQKSGCVERTDEILAAQRGCQAGGQGQGRAREAGA